MATTATQTQPAIDLRWVGFRLADRAAQAQGWFVGGTLLSLLGFSLPWFKHSQGAQWWYSGWQLWRNEGVDWIVVLYLAYLALVVAGFFLLGRNPAGAAATTALAFAVVFGTLVVLGVSTGDALEEIRDMPRLVWSIGLYVMFTGHALLLVAALTGLVLQLLREIVLGK
jgi:hypothetical protein